METTKLKKGDIVKFHKEYIYRLFNCFGIVNTTPNEVETMDGKILVIFANDGIVQWVYPNDVVLATPEEAMLFRLRN